MSDKSEISRQNHYRDSTLQRTVFIQKANFYFRSALAKILSIVRQGPETVLISPPIARGGNWLYEWLAVSAQGQASGKPTYLQKMAGMESWITEFPQLDKLTIAAKDVKFSFIRKSAFHQNLDHNFSAQECVDFINCYLLSSKSFTQRIENAQKILGQESIVLNIRRGDYYSNPIINRNFGIDTIGYVTEAMRLATDEKPTDTIVVTSDDIDWCKENLSFLKDFGKVIFDKENPGPFTDLAFVAAGQRLILTNTTFGYWGGYISTLTQGAQVWVPDIHERANLSGSQQRPMQHLHTWTQVAPPLGKQTWLESEEF